MKTIGLLGGMSWESTAAYYQMINPSIKSALGMSSFNQKSPRKMRRLSLNHFILYTD